MKDESDKQTFKLKKNPKKRKKEKDSNSSRDSLELTIESYKNNNKITQKETEEGEKIKFFFNELPTNKNNRFATASNKKFQKLNINLQKEKEEFDFREILLNYVNQTGRTNENKSHKKERNSVIYTKPNAVLTLNGDSETNKNEFSNPISESSSEYISDSKSLSNSSTDKKTEKMEDLHKKLNENNEKNKNNIQIKNKMIHNKNKMSVKVAVRVRPFNTREKESKSICNIEMTTNQTIIKDELGQPRTFTFDHSFWSHDCYIEQENGYLSPDSSGKYADQSLVFETLGKQILDNAWEGYHCCLFAYGQTGSGKSYSMVGYGANKGIVPISCEEIFKRIANNKDPAIHYEVEVSMLEIYNEKVQDLLVPINKRPPSGLKIRESKALGVFVADLTKYPVSSYEEISNKMEEGYQNRTIGSTLMNNTSSRAHTIVTVEFKQVQQVGKTKSEKLSKINLVDLAGSERANSTGATGERLKEGCNINKSLLILGNVINTLADKASGKKKDVLPPYRDSALTRILQNALGGNSKTVMICALSPASINYEETLSTLRYADRAKKIQNKAVINESEHDKVVRLLKEENNDLKKKIEELSKKLLGGGTIVEEDKEAFRELKAQYDETQKLCENMSKTFSERLEEAKKADKSVDDSDGITSEVISKVSAVKHTSSDNMASYSFNVAGVSYKRKEITALLLENDDYDMSKKEIIDCNMTDEYIYRYTTFMRDVELVPDPDNEHDPNAIKVLSRGVHVGFVPADKTGRVRKILDSRSPEISAEFKGGPYKIVRAVWDDEKMDDVYELEKDNGVMGMKVTMRYEGL